KLLQHLPMGELLLGNRGESGDCRCDSAARTGNPAASGQGALLAGFRARCTEYRVVQNGRETRMGLAEPLGERSHERTVELLLKLRLGYGFPLRSGSVGSTGCLGHVLYNRSHVRIGINYH